MAMTRGTTLSLDEFLALPDEKPHRELIDGRAVQKPMTNRSHMLLVSRLIVAIYEYISRHGGSAGPEGSVLFESDGERRVLLPDVAYWSADRPIGGFPMSPPTLAVEVCSPSQTLQAQRDRCSYYVEHDVESAWLVDPEGRTVDVFGHGSRRSLSSTDELTDPALPGFSIQLDSLFAILDQD